MFCDQTISDRLFDATGAGRGRFASRIAWGGAALFGQGFFTTSMCSIEEGDSSLRSE
jgi:hypothetical protein